MRALAKIESGPGHVGLVDKAEPVPAPHQALVRVTAAGVCGTDLHIQEGGYRSFPPVTMGHEIAGVVSDVGSDEDRSWIGQPVACETFFSTCGCCFWCRDGRPNLCPERRSVGSGADGGFAQYVVVGLTQLHGLPAHISAHAGALCEPLACTCQSLCDPDVAQVGDEVVVIGPGTMGLLAAQVSRACGADVTVVGIEQDELRLAVARDLGFTTAFADDVTTLAKGRGGYGPDIVVECSGSASGMASGLDIVRPGGRYVQIGQRAEPAAVPLALVSFKELTITGGFASTPRSWRRALALLERKAVNLDGLLSAIVPLSEWETVFDHIRRSDGVKYLLDPSR